MKKIYLILLIAAACTGVSEREADLYFDLEKKVESIVQQMQNNQPSLTKIAMLNGEMDTVSVTPDTTQWRNELKLFSSANINKAQLQGVYNVTDRDDENSNLMIRRFEHINPKKSNVPWLEVSFLESPEDCKSIQLEYRENNAGYRLARNLEMNFEEIRGENLLESFKISGYQKIIAKDSVKFEVRGSIDY